MTVLILHGTWSPGGEAGESRRDGHFFAWAERVPAGRRGRRPAAGPRDGAPHPFQARPEETRDAAVTLSPVLARQVDRGTWRLVREWIRLPSRSESPVHSPEAARAVAALGDGGTPAEPVGDGPLLLGTWQVRGVALEAVRAVQLLADLPGDGRIATNSVVLGSDIRFWSAVAKLVVELLARQRVVPTLELHGGEYEAGWRPVMDDPRDVERLARLVQSMPPAARALRGSNGQDEPRARSLVESFLSTAVDGLARTWLSATTSRRLTPSPPPSAGRAWLEALRRGDRVVRASTRELDHISTRLAEWRAPLVTASSSSPYRTCFQLEPPAPPADQAVADVGTPWMLRFFLQATDDPGLLLPAEQVWQEPGSTLVYLNRRFDQPQERLLADLGRAAQTFPALDAALAQPRPSACELTPEDAYAFLRETAWLLEEEGFGVLVPSWWDRRGPRGRLGLRLKLHPPQDRTNGLLGGRSIVEYDWRLAVGDVELSEAEFRQLAALKVPLVCVRGQWVELRPDKIEQAITFWEKQRQTVQIATSAALPLALGTDEVEGLPVLGVSADGWVADLLGRLDDARQIEPLAAPAGFRGELRPYQERGAGWLRFLTECGLGACLADDMGLGKTVQYIAFLLQRRSQPPPRRPALLVCPTSVVGNWRHELKRFAPSLRVMVHHGTGRLGRADLAAAALQHDLVVTSYALVHRDLDALCAVTWDGVVLDEAQNVKNPSTLQARAVRLLSAGYRFALTGTPIENRLTELWSIVDFLNPGYLGTPGAFRQRFVTPIERWQDVERAEQLKELVQPLLLRRLKTDPAIIQDLPEKLEGNVYCTLTAEQASLYQAVVSDMLAQVEATEGIQRRGLVLATLTRLKQVCNHPAHFLSDNSPLPGRSGKLDRLGEMLDEVLAAGDCALVFTQFAEFGSRLREELQSQFGREVLFLHGGVPALQRDEMVRRFQQDPDGPPIFVLSLRAGGVGLNLTRASHVFHFDRWWNPAVENQATDRAFRIGQQRNVQVHKFVCAGTLEEKIDALIESKRALAEQVVGAGEAWLTELSTGELRELLTLRGEAVVE
jgi:SNF2 family DNA or RNA helicase